MLQIFSKKQFLKDLLEDFVDIHNHVLPGIDDGAKTVEASMELLKSLQGLGIKQCILTPHVMQDYYPNTKETIRTSYQHLLDAISSYDQNNIKLKSAAEYMLDAHFEYLLEHEPLLSLKDNYVLIELSYLQAPINLEDLIFKITLNGYRPVLAHPERYRYFHNNLDYYKRLKYLGCLFQLNLLSLSEYYGKSVQKTAKYLLQDNLIDFAGTDVHHLHQVETLANLMLGKKTAGNLVAVIQNTNTTFVIP
ncbi:tyrosine-protein phosphatase [Mariniflexile aquimaris]|uniref:protein-tyrosine-phosphatase n=1 Tax=Mariniflexile aquimaris TaxID=881009 RepID=A0ABW3BUT9_9FLAO